MFDPESVDGHDDAGEAIGKAEGGLHVLDQALVRDAAESLEQGAVEAEVRAQHLWDTHGKVAVRDGKRMVSVRSAPKSLPTGEITLSFIPARARSWIRVPKFPARLMVISKNPRYSSHEESEKARLVCGS